MQSIRDIYDEGEWVDVTTVGSIYEVQLSQRNGQYRHREMSMKQVLGDAPYPEAEWRYGYPKEKKSA